MAGVLQDFRYALRQLRQKPGFTAVAVITIGLGIGATAGMFSLVDRVLFHSLPYPNEGELASVGVVAPIIDGEFLFAANYLDWRQRQTAFTGFASSTGVSDCDLTENNPVRTTCAAVSSTFLPTFGIEPVLGRNFNRDEDRPNTPKVALLSYELWKDRFATDRGVIGQTISIDGSPTRIVGVLPRDFEFPTLAHAGLLVPEALDESIVQRHVLGPVVRVFGRVKRGGTLAQARAELQPLFRDFVESAPPPFRKSLRLEVRTIRDLQVHDSRRAAWLLLISSLAVLFIGCGNAANLLLGRSVARRQELAVRSALGAGSLRLFRQRFTESIVLSALGGAAGLVLAYLIVRVFVELAPESIPHLADARVDARVALVAIVASLISAMLFGTIPALEKPNVRLLGMAARVGFRNERIRQLLMVGQVWISLMLLMAALLFVRSLQHLQSEPLGINTSNVVTAEFTLGQQKYSQAAQRLAFFEEVEQKVKELPGINSVAVADSLPPAAPARTMPLIALHAQGQPEPAPEQGIGGVIGWRAVTPDYFSLLGIPLMRGRAFNESDRSPAAHSIIVNQVLAQQLFPDLDAVGKMVQFRTDRDVLSAPFTVIGVTANVQNQGLGGHISPEYYMVRRHTANDVVFNYPDSQRVSVLVRSALASQSVSEELRSAVASLDPTVPLEVSTMQQSLGKLSERPRFSAALLSLFAFLGMLLTAVGIYGLVALLVSYRTQEIGIRMALGASRSRVVAAMMWRTSLWIAAGTTAGLFTSLILSRWLGSLLYGIRPNDPETLALSAVVLFAIALLGAWIPARRAMKVDPMAALRYE
ncbi:MAG TPA: ABC transporter permease [Candidatus Sulfotelmatobacter sp.]|nr:ABC transporter permease [Candidatus Sulfotelmatobacter sp.]